MNKLALSLFIQNAKYQFGFENMEFKIPDLRYRFIFPINSFQNRRIVKRCSFYMRLN